VVNTGVTLSGGVKFGECYFDTITLNGTGQITGIYQDSTGTSTVLEISGFDAGSAVYVEDNNEVQKFYSASASGTVTIYIPPTGTGSWYYAVEKYGIQRQSDFFTFSGGLKQIVVKAIPDTGLTVLNSATVGAYTELENPDKVYDYVAFLRLSVPHISYGQIVFKDGAALDLQDSDMIVNQSALSVASFNYDDKILTVKSSSMVSGVSYNLIKTTPPKTIEAATTEVISVNIEDANGDSSVNIQGGSGNFTLWKITNATDEDDYETGVNLGSIENETYRFLSEPGFKIVIRDNTTGFRQVVPMDKGVYTRGLFFGDQVQLAQSQEVSQINTKVDILANDVNGIKGTGFTVDVDSLKNISNKVQTLENADLTGVALEATSQEILAAVGDINVDFQPVLDAIDDQTELLSSQIDTITPPDTSKIWAFQTPSLITRALDIILSDTVGVPDISSRNIKASGTSTGAGANRLINDSVDFIKAKVDIGNVVYNVTNQEATKVKQVISAHELLLDDDVVPSGSDYDLYAYEDLGGFMIFVSNNSESETSDVKVLTHGGDEVTLRNIESGQVIPIKIRKVFKTDTTAIKVIALW
jgi:hypothetical protein